MLVCSLLTLSDRTVSLSPSYVLLSIICHHLFICLSLFTSLVSIHLSPTSHPLSQQPSSSLLHLCNVLLSVTHHLRSAVCVYISLLSDSAYASSLSLRSYLSRRPVSVCVCLFLYVCLRPSPRHGWFFESD